MKIIELQDLIQKRNENFKTQGENLRKEDKKNHELMIFDHMYLGT